MRNQSLARMLRCCWWCLLPLSQSWNSDGILLAEAFQHQIVPRRHCKRMAKPPPKHTPLNSALSGSPGDTNGQGTQELRISESLLDKPAQNRRIFLASALATTSNLLITPDKAQAIATTPDGATSTASEIDSYSSSVATLPWKVDPVNKRSGVKVNDAEKSGYNVAFVTYLARFLLNFDSGSQKFWFSSSQIPRTATAEQVENIRVAQFSSFSASVEVGLLDYKGADGAKRLLHDLVERYGNVAEAREDQDRRIARSSRRHIALLFGLMEKNQPTLEVTKLLASVDNGSVQRVQLNNETVLSGYEPNQLPQVIFSPPQAGEDFQVAQGKAFLKSTGKLLRIEVVDAGSGYTPGSQPAVAVSPPKGGGQTAKAQAKVTKQGSLDIKLVDPGSGYSSDEAIEIRVDPPLGEGKPAYIESVLNMAVEDIQVTNGGNGYAVEIPLRVFIDPPSSATSSSGGNQKDQPILAGFAYTTAERTSFTSFRQESDTKRIAEQEQSFEQKYKLKPLVQQGSISGSLTGSADSGAPPLPFWSGRSSSAELLRLLPAGVGLEFDKSQQRYVLAVDTNIISKYPAVLQQGSNRIIGPEFGPRGRSPIERDMDLDVSAYLRFALSGAICASSVYVALTPLDVVKTKIQINPKKYPNIGSSFKTVFKEEGAQTFFTGWLPTLLGNFASGGVLYTTTEYIRRSLSEAAGSDALALEVPIILVAAGTASALGSITQWPVEAVRIRTVAQANASTGGSISIAKSMLKEEGIGAFVDAIPLFCARQVPFAMTKFTVFDISTERLYDAFPAAQEDVKLSLLVSLVGGALGGSAAAFVSNPADAVLSELKKSKTDISVRKAINNMFERNGFATFFAGLPLRMVYYSLVASLVFVVYDFVRFLLRIGPDDLKLYLDVLGGGLASSS